MHHAPPPTPPLHLLQVPGIFYVNDKLKQLMFEELQQYCGNAGYGGFLPAMKQISNVAALPGIVKVGGCGALSNTTPCHRICNFTALHWFA